MKRYLLFAGDSYYPQAGFKDFQGSFDTWEEAKDAFNMNQDWGQVVDSEILSILWHTRLTLGGAKIWEEGAE